MPSPSLVEPEPSKTRRLFLALRHAIACGDLGPGARLPSEAQIGERWRVSRVTVRRALAALERDGLIRRRAGAGTFVNETGGAQATLGDLPGLLGSVRAAGRSTRVKALSIGTVQASLQVAQALALPAGAPVLRCERVRSVDRRPFSYLLSWTPVDVLARVTARELDTEPVVALIERTGVNVGRAVQRLAAQPAAPEVAGALGVPVGTSLVAMTRVAFDEDERPVEYLFAAWHPSHAEFAFDLRRVGRDGARQWQQHLSEPWPNPIGDGRKPSRSRR